MQQCSQQVVHFVCCGGQQASLHKTLCHVDTRSGEWPGEGASRKGQGANEGGCRGQRGEKGAEGRGKGQDAWGKGKRQGAKGRGKRQWGRGRGQGDRGQGKGIATWRPVELSRQQCSQTHCLVSAQQPPADLGVTPPGHLASQTHPAPSA